MAMMASFPMAAAPLAGHPVPRHSRATRPKQRTRAWQMATALGALKETWRRRKNAPLGPFSRPYGPINICSQCNIVQRDTIMQTCVL